MFGASGRSAGAASDVSGAPEADGHLIAVDDDGHRAAAGAVLEHPPHRVRISLDVEVLERNVPPLVVVTGGLRVGSGVLAEDIDHGSL